jgi:putative MATE family efflux protein
MDLLHGKIKQIYFKYLAAAFGSALITSIYGLVDMAMVGQYHGPVGTSSLAVVQPVWNIIYSLGLLAGVGGSVIFSSIRGNGNADKQESNEYFCASLIGAAVLSVLVWIGIAVFSAPILTFFGADRDMLPMAQEYLKPIKPVIPCFLFNQMLAAFLRNDNRPGLATAGVLAGGIFNVLGDWFFVFYLDLGIWGAGFATALGSVISLAVILTHFLSKRNTLKFTRVTKLFYKLKKIFVTGFSTFFIDIAMGILTVLFNRQIMKYLGADALSVYGIIINISTFVQCCAYSVGQAAQPILSLNFGAGNWDRIKESLKWALIATAVLSVFWTVFSLAAPTLYVSIFMSPTEAILRIAPAIIRSYSVSFLLLPFNIFCTYYFQSILREDLSFVISIMRGCVVSGTLIMTLPAFGNANLLWFAMPVTELVTAVYGAVSMITCSRPRSEVRLHKEIDGE